MNFIEAIQKGDLQVVQNLLETNPELVNSKTEQGLSVLLLAMYYQKTEIVNVLLQKKTDFDFFEAAAAGRLDFLQKKLNANPEFLNQYATDGFTALGLASFFSQKEIVKFLLETGADPNKASDNDFKVAPLHSAVASKNLEIVNVLLQFNADANLAQQKGITALHAAAHNGSFEIVKLLVENGANKALKTEEGKTPLDFAREDNYPKVGNFLSKF